MFKSKSTLDLYKNKDKINDDEQYIVQKILRIDGKQTVKMYKKGELLGKGGFANCHTTQNCDTKRKAATKIIQKDLITSQKTKLRLLNEIRLHKTLHHPNVVQFQHYFEDKDNVYIFLELCQNKSLNQLIKTRDYFTTSEVQFFILGIVQGLKYLHSKSIIHRDLKLGNVFLDKQFNIKLGDFGLATKLEFRTQCKRTICGTPNYIAPEVLEGKGYHFEIDIWSVGVMLYTLFYAIPPFQTEDANTTYQKIKKCDFQIPKYMMVPDEANQLIRRILVKNPADRPTLDEILQSDFMQLGGKIFKGLPPICSKKAPGKKDFASIPFHRTSQLIKSITSHQAKISSSAKQAEINEQTPQFLVQFDILQDDTIFYMSNTGVASVIGKNGELVYKDEFGTIRQVSVENKNMMAQINGVTHPLKTVLNYKLKLEALQSEEKVKPKKKEVLMETTLFPCQKAPLRVLKTSKQRSMNMVRLSNQTIQFFFQDESNFLVTKQSEIFEIQKNKITNKVPITIKDLQKILSGQSKNDGISVKSSLDKNKAFYIKGLLRQIQKLKASVKAKTMKEELSLNCQNYKTQDKNSALKRVKSQILPFKELINKYN